MEITIKTSNDKKWAIPNTLFILVCYFSFFRFITQGDALYDSRAWFAIIFMLLPMTIVTSVFGRSLFYSPSKFHIDGKGFELIQGCYSQKRSYYTHEQILGMKKNGVLYELRPFIKPTIFGWVHLFVALRLISLLRKR